MTSKVFDKKLLPDTFSPKDLVGDAAYADSVYKVGILEPILVQECVDGTYTVIAGNRRILSFLEARKRASEDGTLINRPWLDTIPARVYPDITTVNKFAIMLVENEERGKGDLRLYHEIRRCIDEGLWDEVKEIYALNAKRFEEIMRYGNVDKKLVKAYEEGKVTKGNLSAISRLGEKYQEKLVDKLEEKKADGKKAVITAGDIKDVKSSRSALARSAMPFDNLPSIEPTEKSVARYLALSKEELDKLDFVFTDIQTAKSTKKPVFLLVEM